MLDMSPLALPLPVSPGSVFRALNSSGFFRFIGALHFLLWRDVTHLSTSKTSLQVSGVGPEDGRGDDVDERLPKCQSLVTMKSHCRRGRG